MASGRLGVDLVAGDLELDEPIVRHVVVEGPDHEVAVVVGVLAVVVLLVAVALGEPRQVEPVPRPALAVMRGCSGADRPGAS